MFTQPPGHQPPHGAHGGHLAAQYVPQYGLWPPHTGPWAYQPQAVPYSRPPAYVTPGYGGGDRDCSDNFCLCIPEAGAALGSSVVKSSAPAAGVGAHGGRHPPMPHPPGNAYQQQHGAAPSHGYDGHAQDWQQPMPVQRPAPPPAPPVADNPASPLASPLPPPPDDSAPAGQESLPALPSKPQPPWLIAKLEKQQAPPPPAAAAPAASTDGAAVSAGGASADVADTPASPTSPAASSKSVQLISPLKSTPRKFR